MFKIAKSIIFLSIILYPISSSAATGCYKSIDEVFESIQNYKLDLDTKVYQNNKDFDWKKKSSIISFNYRNFNCSTEMVCLALESYLLSYNGKQWSWDIVQPQFTQSVIWCTPYEVDYKKLNECLVEFWWTRKMFTEITDTCYTKRNEIIKFEKSRISQEFEAHVMQRKSFFVSAKLYAMNTKMRGLSSRMSKLRNLFGRIITKVTCTLP